MMTIMLQKIITRIKPEMDPFGKKSKEFRKLAKRYREQHKKCADRRSSDIEKETTEDGIV